MMHLSTHGSLVAPSQEMSSLGLATLLGGLCGGVPMNATSAMTDLNKEGIKGDPLAARYTVPLAALSWWDLFFLVGDGLVPWCHFFLW